MGAEGRSERENKIIEGGISGVEVFLKIFWTFDFLYFVA